MGKRGGRGGGGRKANVQHTGIGEAPFILKLREQYGLKSREEQRNDDVEAKFGDDDARSSRKARPVPDDPNLLDVQEDDQPEVVVLNKGDLTREEAEKAILSGAEGVQGVLSAANKTEVEKRLTKDRENMRKTLHATTKKKASAKTKAGDAEDGGGGADDDDSNPKKKNKKKGKSKRPKLSKALNKKNTGLLSFGDEEY